MADKRLAVRDAEGRSEELPYDALMVGTGAVSVRPPVEGLSGPNALDPQDGVHLLHSMGDTFAVVQTLAERRPRSAVVVYAAGDCAVTHHRLLGRTWLPLGTTAHKQGRIAGENALGGSRRFAGSLGTQVVKVFDLVAALTACATAKPQTPDGAGLRRQLPAAPTTTRRTTRAPPRSPSSTTRHRAPPGTRSRSRRRHG